MKEAISRQAGKYNEKFGVSPEFKAGFHFGNVTTGEIGVIKKDIIFTGDVLNTTAGYRGFAMLIKLTF
jgi:adenylate cyclase